MKDIKLSELPIDDLERAERLLDYYFKTGIMFFDQPEFRLVDLDQLGNLQTNEDAVKDKNENGDNYSIFSGRRKVAVQAPQTRQGW